jgi:hypothetical protein
MDRESDRAKGAVLTLPSNIPPSLRAFLERLVGTVRALEGRVTALDVRQTGRDLGQGDPTARPFDYEGFDLAADGELTHSQLGKDLYVNCTVASNLKMPTFTPNGWANIRNIGTQTISMKENDGTAIDTVVAGAGKEIRFKVDSSGGAGGISSGSL